MKRFVMYLLLGTAVVIGLASTSCGEQQAESVGDPGTTTTAISAEPIVVERPARSESVSSPVEIAGTANVFEANVTVQILDENGTELARDFTTATCGTGCRGNFSIRLAYRSPKEQSGTIVVSDDDADGDGSPSHSVSIPVQLAQS
jgi:hypothetical protein